MATDDPSPARAILPTLRQLSFLAALAEQGGFVRAAQAVGVTQPTLSAGIKELEAILGVTLVDRSQTGAVLTLAGEEAAQRAQTTLSEVEALVRAVRAAGAPMSGAFRLGAIPTIAPFLLPRALAAFGVHFPRLQLTLKEDLTHRLVDALRARTLDAALIALPYEAQGVEVEAFAEDEFLLLAPLGHRLLSSAHLRVKDLADEPVLLLEDGHCLRDHALVLCKAPPPGRRAAEVGATSLHTLTQFVGAGLGVTLLPKLAADAGIAAGAPVGVRAFEPTLIGRALGVAWRAGSARAGESRALAGVLKALLARAADGPAPASAAPAKTQSRNRPK
jgi:LysR family transcriptional regulator, hydrogen peroxide-inducible genes activator